MATRTVKPTKGQRVVFVLMVICTIPFSLVYLALWRGRCAYCGKRIFFNRRVCKKCDTRAHEIVDNFDEKIEMFYQQMGVIDDITDIISQYEYVVNQFQGINDIYEALDEEVDTKSMEEKPWSICIEPWKTGSKIVIISLPSRKGTVRNDYRDQGSAAGKTLLQGHFTALS